MPDEWSGGVTTLTDAGDWAKWTITLGSGDAADLNDPAAGNLYLAIRWAMSAATRSGYFALIVNDIIGFGLFFDPPQVLFSSAGWTSAGRFRGGIAGSESFGAVEFPITSPVTSPGLSSSAFASGPWVAGTNTVRFLWLGRNNDGAAEPIEIDFISIQTGSGADIIGDWGNFGSDGGVAAADLKPVTHLGVTGYDDLVDGGQITASSMSTWLLKGDEPSTGTAADSVIEVLKYCPPIAKIRVTGAGDPVTGIVGAYDTSGPTATTTTLDGAGEATFTVSGSAGDVDFWYGGNDDWTPAAVNVDGSDRIGCGGWNVGRIGMAS